MKKLLFILLTAASVNAYSYCAGRYYPDTKMCEVIAPDGSPVFSYDEDPDGNGGNTRSAAPPPPRTEIIRIPDKWGAVSLNTSNGYIHDVKGMASDRAAQKAALRQCINDGGNKKSCTILYAYANGCVAVAGATLQGETKTSFADGGETRAAAEQAAMAKCEKAGRTDCRIVMPAQCSLPD